MKDQMIAIYKGFCRHQDVQHTQGPGGEFAVKIGIGLIASIEKRVFSHTIESSYTRYSITITDQETKAKNSQSLTEDEFNLLYKEYFAIVKLNLRKRELRSEADVRKLNEKIKEVSFQLTGGEEVAK